MSALSQVHAAELLESSLRSGNHYLALFLTDPTSENDGVEVVGGGYARKPIQFSPITVVSGKNQVSNAEAIDYGIMSADIGTVSYWGIYDAATGGTLKWFGSFSRAKNVQNGDAITILTGAIVCTLS